MVNTSSNLVSGAKFLIMKKSIVLYTLLLIATLILAKAFYLSFDKQDKLNVLWNTFNITFLSLLCIYHTTRLWRVLIRPEVVLFLIVCLGLISPLFR